MAESPKEAFARILAEAGIDPRSYRTFQDLTSKGIRFHCDLHPAWANEAKYRERPCMSESGQRTNRAAPAMRLAERVVGLVRRDEAIASQGADPANPPAWAFRMHPVLLALLRSRGIGVDELASQSWRETSNSGQGRRISGEGMHGTLDYLGETISCTRMTFSGISIRTRNSTNITILMDAGRGLPETVMKGIVGEPVNKVVALPDAGVAVAITSAKWNSPTLELGLEPKLLRLAKIPKGVDRRWTSTIRSAEA